MKDIKTLFAYTLYMLDKIRLEGLEKLDYKRLETIYRKVVRLYRKQRDWRRKA